MCNNYVHTSDNTPQTNTDSEIVIFSLQIHADPSAQPSTTILRQAQYYSTYTVLLFDHSEIQSKQTNICALCLRASIG